jgi:hypothetical protein
MRALQNLSYASGSQPSAAWPGVLDETEFWDDVDASLGTLWFQGAESATSVPADEVY